MKTKIEFVGGFVKLCAPFSNYYVTITA